MNPIELWKKRGMIFDGIKNRIFKQEHVEEIAAKRIAICKECKFYSNNNNDCFAPGTAPCCSECGCCLALKTRCLSAECEEGKWEAILTEEEEDKLNEIL